MHSKFKDLTIKIVDYDDPDLKKPDEESIKEVTFKLIIFSTNMFNVIKTIILIFNF